MTSKNLRPHDLDEPSPYPAAARWPPSGYTLDRGPRRRRVCKPCPALLLLGRPRVQRPAPGDVHACSPAHQRSELCLRSALALLLEPRFSPTPRLSWSSGAGRRSVGGSFAAGLRLRPALPQRGCGDPEPCGLRAAGAARLLQEPGWAGLGPRWAASQCLRLVVRLSTCLPVQSDDST